MLTAIADQVATGSSTIQTERVLVIPDVPTYILLVLVVILGLCVILGMALSLRQLKVRQRLPRSLHMVTLLVTLPRMHKDELEKEKNQGGDENEIISVAETMYANLSAIDSFTKSWRRTFFGRDVIALELVLVEDEIRFYVACPRRLQSFVERQIQSQYPKSQIEEAGEYTIFRPGYAVRAARLALIERDHIPVRTYDQLESDPLNALTNAMAKIPDTMGAAIQLVIRPASRKAAQRGRQAAQDIQLGKRDAQGKKVSAQTGSTWSKLLPGMKDNQQQQMPERPQLTPLDEELVRALETKTNKIQFETNIRVVVSAPTVEQAELELNGMLSSFEQYRAPRYNGFKVAKRVSQRKLVQAFIFRYFLPRHAFTLNTAELASIFHFPTKFTETPKVVWLGSKKAPPPQHLPTGGVLLGYNTYRGVETEVRIEAEDRMRHMYVIGRTGTGKTTVMENMIVQDIRNGDGVCVIDPHGDLVEHVLEQTPKERAEDVVVFAPADTDRPVGMNMLEFYGDESKDFVVQEMIAIFYKLFPPEMIGPMFEHQMRNVMLTLMADANNPGTIVEIPRMFTDEEFQKQRVEKVRDPVVRAFWEQEMAKTSDYHKSEMLGYLVSKVGRFVENEMMRNIIGQAKSGFNVSDIMNNQKILLVNLSKGTVGEVNSDLLGLVLVSKIQMAAFQRAAMPESQRKDFFLYIDEFQNYTTDSIATILSEARKYRLGMTIAHQYVGQLVTEGGDAKIRDAVFGNIGSMMAYRIGVDDAEIFAKEFEPVFDANDVINIEKFNAYIKLMVNGTTSQPFNVTVPPPERMKTGGNTQLAAAIKQLSRMKYGRDRMDVEEDIMRRAQLGAPGTQAAAHDSAQMGIGY